MNALTELRTTVCEALLFVDIPAYSAPQPTTPIPSVTIAPGNPYLAPMSLKAFEVNLTLTLMVPAFDTAASLQVLEEMTFKCLKALPQGVHFVEVDAPQLVSLGEAQGKVYQTVITITAQVKE